MHKASNVSLPLAMIELTVLSYLSPWDAPSAFAQEFPAKPIRYIVPYSPGTAQDIIARVMAPEMAKTLGQVLSSKTEPVPIR